jgi:hypothetical protein
MEKIGGFLKMAWFCKDFVMNLKGKNILKGMVRGGKRGFGENSRETQGVGMCNSIL